MCVHTYIHTYTYIHIYMYLRAYIQIYTHRQPYTYVYTHIHTHTYIHIYIYMTAHTYIHIHVYMYYTCPYMCPYTPVCLYIHTGSQGRKQHRLANPTGTTKDHADKVQTRPFRPPFFRSALKRNIIRRALAGRNTPGT